MSGALAKIRSKLARAVPEEVVLENLTGMDIDVEEFENCDGSRPRLLLKLVRVVQKDMLKEQERGVL